jgi:archaellin
MRRCQAGNSSGSQGLSAMIIMVALVLVSSVIAIVLITFGQEIFTNSGDDATASQNAIYGKILVRNAVITAIKFDGNNDPIHANIQITLELSAGTSPIDDDLVTWSVLCQREDNPNNDRWANDGNLEAATSVTGDGGDIGDIDTLEVGKVYMLTIALQHTQDTDNDQVLDNGGCPPNYQETHTLIFAMGGSGSYSSWELRYDAKLEVGDYLI